MVYRAKSTDAVSQPSHIVASQCTRWRIGSKHPPVRGIIKPMVRGSAMDTDAPCRMREAARTANCALVMDGRFEVDQPLRGA